MCRCPGILRAPDALGKLRHVYPGKALHQDRDCVSDAQPGAGRGIAGPARAVRCFSQRASGDGPCACGLGRLRNVPHPGRRALAVSARAQG